MRRQISVLVAVVSTAIVASFVIPLLLLVRGMPALLRPLVGSRWPGLFAAAAAEALTQLG